MPADFHGTNYVTATSRLRFSLCRPHARLGVSENTYGIFQARVARSNRIAAGVLDLFAPRRPAWWVVGCAVDEVSRAPLLRQR